MTRTEPVQALVVEEAYVAARQSSGDSIRLRIFRDGTEFEVEVALDREAHLSSAMIGAAFGLLADASSKVH